MVDLAPAFKSTEILYTFLDEIILYNVLEISNVAIMGSKTLVIDDDSINNCLQTHYTVRYIIRKESLNGTDDEVLFDKTIPKSNIINLNANYESITIPTNIYAVLNHRSDEPSNIRIRRIVTLMDTCGTELHTLISASLMQVSHDAIYDDDNGHDTDDCKSYSSCDDDDVCSCGKKVCYDYSGCKY